jgi:hypothetical protein
MLVLSWGQLDALSNESELGFETEYHWENFILRLWIYRTTVQTLKRIQAINDDAKNALGQFDSLFIHNGRNMLQDLRNMIEHFDERAAGIWRGLGTRTGELDPWRTFNRDKYERGLFCLERGPSYSAAIRLRLEAERMSAAFIQWYKSND